MHDTSFYTKEFRNWLYYFHFTQKQHESKKEKHLH